MQTKGRTAVVLALLAAGGPARADQKLDLEVGSEADSNVHRSVGTAGQSADAVPGAGGRLGARYAGAFRLSRRHALRVHMALFGKAFLAPDEAAEEDVAVVSGDARWDLRLSDPLALSALVSLYDAMEDHSDPDDDRDFRTADGSLALTLRSEGGHFLIATAGHRVFDYKPNPAYDFAGDHIGLAWHKAWQRDGDDAPTWELAASYGAFRRRYDYIALTDTCVGQPNPCHTDVQRVDLLHAAAVQLTYTGTRILSARYELQVNDSNSVGQSFQLHRLELSATTELWNDVFLTSELVAQINRGAPGSAAFTYLTIEDESRNALIFHLTRDLTDAFSLEARVALYTNAFATDDVSYRRATVYAGAVYSVL